MDFPASKEGFYKLMQAKREEIAALPSSIPEDMRQRAYAEIEKEIRRYEENAEGTRNSLRAFHENAGGINQLGESLGGVLLKGYESAGKMGESCATLTKKLYESIEYVGEAAEQIADIQESAGKTIEHLAEVNKDLIEAQRDTWNITVRVMGTQRKISQAQGNVDSITQQKGEN